MKVKIVKVIDNKTFKGLSTRYKKHEKYGKYTTVYKKYLVDSNNASVQVGDEVEIVGCRPISKNKKWVLK